MYIFEQKGIQTQTQKRPNRPLRNSFALFMNNFILVTFSKFSLDFKVFRYFMWMLDFNDRPNSSYIGSPPTAEIAVDLPNKKNTCGIKQEQLNCINCSVVTCFSCISVFILVVCSHGARCHRANKHLLRARNSFDVARSLLVHGSGEKNLKSAKITMFTRKSLQWVAKTARQKKALQ